MTVALREGAKDLPNIDLIYSLGLGLLLLGSAFLAWRTWRDPDNWRLDLERGGITFNHWKELALALGICAAFAGMLVYWLV